MAGAQRTKKKGVERVENKDKVAKRNKKLEEANEGNSRACQKKEKARKKWEEQNAKQAQLEEAAQKAGSEAAVDAIRRQIKELQEEIKQGDVEMKEAEEEEANFQKQEDSTNKENMYDEMVVDDDYDPNKPIESIKSSNTNQQDISDLVKRLRDKGRIEDSSDVLNINIGIELRDTQAPLCWKDSARKPVIVVNCKFPKNRIYRIRIDVAFT
jgi:hypothetical protein